MQNYELRCRKLSGEFLATRLGEFASLIDALESLGEYDAPLPEYCLHWAVTSADGMEMAAKRG